MIRIFGTLVILLVFLITVKYLWERYIYGYLKPQTRSKRKDRNNENN